MLSAIFLVSCVERILYMLYMHLESLNSYDDFLCDKNIWGRGERVVFAHNNRRGPAAETAAVYVNTCQRRDRIYHSIVRLGSQLYLSSEPNFTLITYDDHDKLTCKHLQTSTAQTSLESVN